MCVLSPVSFKALRCRVSANEINLHDGMVHSLLVPIEKMKDGLPPSTEIDGLIARRAFSPSRMRFSPSPSIIPALSPLARC